MRKLILCLLGASALSFGAAANASISIDPGTTVNVGGGVSTTNAGVDFSIGYSDSGVSNSFDELLVFTNSLAGSYSFVLTSIAVGNNDADFDAVFLTGGSIVGQFDIPEAMISTDPFEIFGILGLNLGAGTYTLHLQGTSTGNGAFGGNVAFTSVPEPATWGMMLLGFGAIGYAIRRRRRPALLQIA